MYVITFYSFKGGVGRTMALVNVAAELVRRGRKVLVVDFDLEAPGLETYKQLRPPEPHPGIVEYVTEYRRTNQVPNLPDYIYETKPIGKKGGRLWVMPAGRRDSAYRSFLSKLDWQRLYKHEEGFLLFEDTKAGWEQELKPDYVLIDSRTGDTEVQGICTRQLPDAVVLMFMPNEQNLAGLENVVHDIRREETEGLKKKIQLHFVAANVPNLDDERSVLRRQLKTFRERLKFSDLAGVIRRYESLNLLDQSVFAVERPRTRLAHSYRRLLRTLVKDNPADRDGALAFLSDCLKLYLPDSARNQHWSRFNLLMSAYVANDKIDNITNLFWDDAQILLKAAECRVLESDFGLALPLLDQAVTVNPGLSPALLQRALCKNRLGDVPGAVADMFQYIQAKDLRPQDVLRALRELAAISPNNLHEAVQLFSVKDLCVQYQTKVAAILASSHKGLDAAIAYLKSVLNGFELGDPSVESVVELLSEYFIRTKRWEDAVELIERATAATTSFHVCLMLSLGHLIAEWGHTGSLPESLCRWWLQHAENEGNTPYGTAELHQVNALASWRLGNLPRAQQEIEAASLWVTQRGRDSFSCWRYAKASPSEFLVDCEQIRRMFQGEPLRPAFLGPPTPQTATQVSEVSTQPQNLRS